MVENVIVEIDVGRAAVHETQDQWFDSQFLLTPC